MQSDSFPSKTRLYFPILSWNEYWFTWRNSSHTENLSWLGVSISLASNMMVGYHQRNSFRARRFPIITILRVQYVLLILYAKFIHSDSLKTNHLWTSYVPFAKDRHTESFIIQQILRVVMKALNTPVSRSGVLWMYYISWNFLSDHTPFRLNKQGTRLRILLWNWHRS